MSNEQFEFLKKPIADTYRFWSKSGLWAHIYLDIASEKAGRLIIVSDYGVWQYYWGACGPGFKQFLIGLIKSRDYFIGKLEPQPTYYHHRFIASIKAHLNANKNKLKAYPHIFNELEIVENEDPKTMNECYQLLHCQPEEDLISYIRNSDRSWLEDACGPSRGLERFLDEVWPQFIKVLEKEIDSSQGM